MTESEPSAFALETAIVIPRSLKEPVGFNPSYLRYSSVPGAIRRASAGAGTRGVFPSRSVTTDSSGTEVKTRLYWRVFPCQCISSRVLLEVVFDPDHPRPVEDIGETVHLGERGTHVALLRPVCDDEDGNRGLPLSLLEDGRDADRVIPQDPRDSREDAGLVHHPDLQVILAVDLVERREIRPRRRIGEA